jgi:hypothetical protein
MHQPPARIEVRSRIGASASERVAGSGFDMRFHTRFAILPGSLFNIAMRCTIECPQNPMLANL